MQSHLLKAAQKPLFQINGFGRGAGIALWAQFGLKDRQEPAYISLKPAPPPLFFLILKTGDKVWPHRPNFPGDLPITE